MGPLAALDELYSVSDLPLGGPPGFQIFNQGRRLAALIDLLRTRPKDRQVGLVLNGDIVDFLAEEGAAYLSPDQAVRMLERIFQDPAFAPVWQALGRFVRAPRRLLVLALGNHDVELAIPPVQARVLQELCGDDAGARGRVVFAMDGGGFRCQVGHAQVFCTHGNEVDPWNIVDYEALARVAEAQRRGQPPPAWDPNAGTQLVIDVMNGIKRRYPFVDLLKPETKVVPQMLLALDSNSLGSLKNFGGILYRKARGSVRTGYLGADDELRDPEEQRRMEESLRDLLLGPRWRQPPPAEGEAELLRQMDADFLAGMRPLQLVAGPDGERMLGLGQYLWDRITGQRSPEEAMRMALRDWLAGDRTFASDTEDESSQRFDERVNPEYDFVQLPPSPGSGRKVAPSARRDRRDACRSRGRSASCSQPRRAPSWSPSPAA